MSEEELHLAHNKIAQRLLLFRNEQQAQILKSLKLGDRVSFDYKSERIEGTIIKLNKLTAKIVDTKNNYWNISPSLLIKIISNNKIANINKREIAISREYQPSLAKREL